MKDLSFLQSYAEKLIKKSYCISEFGLWDGKMGMVITLFHLYRITQEVKYEIKANDLVEEVYRNISSSMSYHLADGLLGIGCGLEYIIEQGFVNGVGDEILLEVDDIASSIILSRPMDSLDVGKGVCGIGCYLYCRLKEKPESDESLITLQLKECLIYLIDWIEELLLNTTDKKDHYNVYFLLCRLHKLNVFNFKVEKLMKTCLIKMEDCDFPVVDLYDFLGINSLKVLKPWM